MVMDKEYYNLNVPIKRDIYLKAKSKAWMLGLTLKEYLANIIDEDTKKINLHDMRKK